MFNRQSRHARFEVFEDQGADQSPYFDTQEDTQDGSQESVIRHDSPPSFGRQLERDSGGAEMEIYHESDFDKLTIHRKFRDAINANDPIEVDRIISSAQDHDYLQQLLNHKYQHQTPALIALEQKNFDLVKRLENLKEGDNPPARLLMTVHAEEYQPLHSFFQEKYPDAWEIYNPDSDPDEYSSGSDSEPEIVEAPVCRHEFLGGMEVDRSSSSESHRMEVDVDAPPLKRTKTASSLEDSPVVCGKSISVSEIRECPGGSPNGRKLDFSVHGPESGHNLELEQDSEFSGASSARSLDGDVF